MTDDPLSAEKEEEDADHDKANEAEEDVPEELDEHDPMADIFRIIRRYYKGLKREEEGMGSE